MTFKILLLLSITVCLSNAAKWPSKYPKCKYGDSVCFQKIVETIVTKSAVTGDTDINLLPLKPLHISELKMQRGGDGPISLNAVFTDLDLFGVDIIPTSITGFNKELDKATIEATLPLTSLIGNYDMSGKVLVLPIQGKGKCNFTLTNSIVKADLTLSKEKRKNREIVHITKFKLDIQPSNLNVQLENLFNGNKELGQTTIDFINKNWSEVWKDLKDVIEKAVGEVIIQVANNVLEKFDYNDIFLDA